MNAPTSQNTRFTRHGPVRVASGGRHLAHADRTPFFYLADTAWNGALLSTDDEWREYLRDRAARGFTAIQFILTAPWSAAPTDAEGRVAFDEPSGRPNDAFFRRMDERIAAINDAGLLAAPVLVWAARFGPSARLNPGHTLRTRDLLPRLAFLRDRYRSRHLLWILAGDGRYNGWWRRERWRAAGALFAGEEAPVTLHPMGLTWPDALIQRDPWLTLLGYQSGHSTADATLRWLLTGPPATTSRTTRPRINLEPCYEGIRNWGGAGPITHGDVRRALYASLLNAPTAGVAYGAHGIWSWERQPREPLNHPGTGVAPPWREALHLPGARDVQHLADFFTSLHWWSLAPAPDLLAAQPAPGDWHRFVSCAATLRRSLALCYLPRGGAITLTRTPSEAEWIDPRTGTRLPASSTRTFTAPSEDDWLLLLRRLP